MFSLLKDYMRRAWLPGMLASVAVFAFFVISAHVFKQIQNTGDGMPFAQLMPQWLQSAFNISPANMSNINGFYCVCFQHPVVLITLLGMPIAIITAFLTGDVEKRTLALVLARPVSRWTIGIAMALVVFFWVAVALVSLVAGSHFGAGWTGQAGVLNVPGIEKATIMLGLLVFCFTGLVAALSAMLSVRGDAVGWALTVILVMYVWNFLAQVWSGARQMANYSLFHYYQPTEIILQGAFSMANAQLLGIIGLIGWAIALLVFRFRSFPL